MMNIPKSGLIHKKGDNDNIGNYTPISLFTDLFKKFSKIKLEKPGRESKEQTGFSKDFYLLDHNTNHKMSNEV